jgi:uncharacterized protein DUF6627
MRKTAINIFLVYFAVWLVAIGCVPVDGMAMLIPSDTELSLGSRTADLQAVQATLESKLVVQRLTDVGLTLEEAQARLASLTDDQLHQVAQHLDGLQPGGELILILAIIGAIVVVLAIIGLARQA